MKLNDFKLEVFFGKHEFSAPYLLTQSDCESMSIRELLQMEENSEELLLDTWLGYTEVSGSPVLKKQIASLYETIFSEDVIVHAGAQEPIFNLVHSLLEPSDHVISQFPVYQSLYEVARSIGCEVDFWELKNENQKWSMDFNDLKALIKDNTKLICVNNPNNPTGFIFNKEEMKELAKICDENNIFLLCDEVYKGLELNATKVPWMADLSNNAISIGVMSKAYGLAGLRIGWVASKNKEVLEKMTKMKHYTSICSSGPSEVLASIALNHSDEILSNNKSLIKENIELANQFFSKYNDLFENNQPLAGPVAFHKMNIDEPINDFVVGMVEEAGILLLSGDIYDYSGQYFRIGYGRKDFQDNLKKFEEYLKLKELI